MDSMRLAFGTLLAVFLAFAPAALAQSRCEACEVQNIDPDSSWDWDDPTMESMQGSTPRPPTYLTCTAWGSSNQRCRSCEPAYYDNGMPKGYDVCAFVARHANCRCKTSPCYGEGSCSYS